MIRSAQSHNLSSADNFDSRLISKSRLYISVAIIARSRPNDQLIGAVKLLAKRPRLWRSVAGDEQRPWPFSGSPNPSVTSPAVVTPGSHLLIKQYQVPHPSPNLMASNSGSSARAQLTRIACRQCGKDFNPLWRRAHTCGHCGYEYCNTCISDGQALMPRKPGQGSLNKGPLAEIRSGLGLDDRPAGSGYEVESVCVPCLSMLQGGSAHLPMTSINVESLVTCAPVDSLRKLPLKRLKDYLAAYNIPNVGPKEKEDFVQAVVKARNPQTGSLSQEAEVRISSSLSYRGTFRS